MSRESGLWIAVGGNILATKIAYAIETRWEFSYPIPQVDYKPRRAELVIVALSGTTPEYIGLSVRGRPSTTGQTTVIITNLMRVKRLKERQIRKLLSRRFSTHYSPPSSGIYRPTPKLWKALLDILIADTPANKARMVSIRRLLAEANRVSVSAEPGGLEVFERDAIASSLQAWAGPTVRRRILRSASPRKNKKASFLERLKSVTSREDSQINHDHTVFPGMTIAARDIISSVTLTDDNDSITILNCNRQPLERTLGVDLIYYSHRFEAFTLVQYKRMVDRDGTLLYRPHSDASHAKEIARMKIASRLLQTLPHDTSRNIDSFRLNSNPFFIKLCADKASIALDSGMVSGMYIPLRLWENLLRSSAVVGPKGGVQVTWDNCPRRFSNGQFTGLLRNGWIGSAESHTVKLSEIIEGVLSSRRMLIVAATRPGGHGSRDYRRDNWGRFADQNDPEGAF